MKVAITQVRDLFDVWCLFDGMTDPVDPAGKRKVLISGSEKIMRHEMSYVQLGLLSDLPRIAVYAHWKTLSTGFELMRNLRGIGAALEGGHLCLRAAEHPCAKAQGPSSMNARHCWYMWASNVREAFRC